MSLAQGNNTPTRPRIEPGSPDPESDALTTRPVRPTGGSAYDGRQQVLYWADVMSEIAFVVPSAEMYNRYLADPHGGKCSPDRYRR